MRDPENDPGRTPGRDPGDPHGEPRGDAPFSYMRRRRQTRNAVPIMAGILGLILLGVGAYWLLLRPQAEPDLPLATPGMEDRQPVTQGPGADVPPLDLPSLSASDAFVRGLVSRLSQHPQLAAWLVTDALVHRFVGTVVNLAGGASPTGHVEFLIPADELRVQESGGRLVIDPISYRRFDLLAETFVSLDTRGTTQLYRQLHPLFEEAYAELGIPELTFDQAMEQAVANVLAARIPEGPLEVVPVEGWYEFADPSIENRTEAEKHLLRMGPENARRVQAKVGELADGLGMGS